MEELCDTWRQQKDTRLALRKQATTESTIMANVIINSTLKTLISEAGHTLPGGKSFSIAAGNISRLIAELDRLYPGCGTGLSHCAVAIDGDIYSDALTEPLDELTEVVFMPSIEGG